MKRRKKGYGTIRKRKDGRWEGRYKDYSGNIRYLYCIKKSELVDKLNRLINGDDISVFDDVSGNMPLKLWYEHYIDIKRLQVKERSLYQIKIHIEKYVLPIIGDKILYKISTNDIINIIKNAEQQELKKNTINSIMRHMRAMFNYAFAEGVINKNPMLTLKTERDRKAMRRDLTPEEINILLKAVNITDYNFYLMLCTLLYTGIRTGELCALKWNDFSDDFKYMRIDESFTDLIYENDTKTLAGERTLPLNDYLQIEYQQKFNNLTDKEKGEVDKLVYINKRNRPFTSNNISLRLNSLKKYIRENMNVDIDEGITPHYFRHTFVSNGMRSGVSLKDMQELLGHSNSRTLLDYYAHTNNSSKNVSIKMIQDSIDLSRYDMNL